MAADGPGADVEAGMRAARALGREGNDRGAVSTLRRVLAWHPEHAPALALLGLHLDYLGDGAGARNACRAAVSLDPNDAVAHRLLGIVLGRRMGGRREALLHLHEAVRLDHADPNNHFQLANLLAALTYRRKALSAYRAACALAPDDPVILGGTAEYLFGRCRSREAKVLAARALVAGPDNVVALTAAARSRLCDGRSTDARDLARAAVDLDAGHPPALAVLIEAELCRFRAFALWSRIRGWTLGGRLRSTALLFAFGTACSTAIGLIGLDTRGSVAVVSLYALGFVWAIVPALILRRRIEAAQRPVRLRRRF
ncbi:hypothetical protein [uncultured Methylobacterium sp.]|uniref:hypothetical protein n=1 Tax=uncultured Methylobacterium sp. TaxID=157278 RepID=UPI0035CA5C66